MPTVEVHSNPKTVVNVCSLFYLTLLGEKQKLMKAFNNSIEIRFFDTPLLDSPTITSKIHYRLGFESDSEIWYLHFHIKERIKYIFKYPCEDISVTLSRRRTHSLNETIIFLMKYSDTICSEQKSVMRDCFRALWRIHLFPFIRVQEIRRIFCPEDNSGLCGGKCLKYVNLYCELYSKDFPDMSLGNVTPRCLKHMCRYGIRKLLMKYSRWSDGIDNLKLPRALVAYLKLEY